MKQPQMRSQEEIKAAHDLLGAILDDPELRAEFGAAHCAHLTAAGSVLCWVLHHDAPWGPSAARSFQEMLDALREVAAETCPKKPQPDVNKVC